MFTGATEKSHANKKAIHQINRNILLCKRYETDRLKDK